MAVLNRGTEKVADQGLPSCHCHKALIVAATSMMGFSYMFSASQKHICWTHSLDAVVANYACTLLSPRLKCPKHQGRKEGESKRIQPTARKGEMVPNIEFLIGHYYAPSLFLLLPTFSTQEKDKVL